MVDKPLCSKYGFLGELPRHVYHRLVLDCLVFPPKVGEGRKTVTVPVFYEGLVLFVGYFDFHLTMECFTTKDLTFICKKVEVSCGYLVFAPPLKTIRVYYRFLHLTEGVRVKVIYRRRTSKSSHQEFEYA